MINKETCKEFALLHLAECAEEILEWKRTAILRDGKLRELGDLVSKWIGEGGDNLRVAEAMVCDLSLEEITRLRAKLAESQKREQELLSERKGEGVRTRRAIALAKKKWLAEAEGQECVVMLAVNTESGVVDYNYLQYDMRSEQETKTEAMALVDGWEYRPFKVVPLTHPAPAKVPERMTYTKAAQIIDDDPERRKVPAFVYGWNACREAMLKSQGGE